MLEILINSEAAHWGITDSNKKKTKKEIKISQPCILFLGFNS